MSRPHATTAAARPPRESEALAGPAEATYLGTTAAPSVTHRVALAGEGRLGDAVTLTVDREGLHIRSERGGWFVPRADLRGARPASRHAGTRAPAGGALLSVTWVLDGTGLISGFELGRESDPGGLVAAIQAVVPS